MVKEILADRYELLERIGDGGMASVYRAHDQLLDRYVAVKILHPQFANDEEFIIRFKKEAQGAAKLSHINIVNIYDVGEWQEKHFIVMEYVEGETLKNKIQTEGKLSIRDTLNISVQIGAALEHAHAHNLIHCDIKPHNILLKPNGQVKVADFGIARAASSSTMTYSGNVVGSVHYISPEQAQGNAITPKSDIYSLGVVIYEMLTGQVPFKGENVVSIALKHLQEMPVPIHELRPDVPPVVEAIVLKAMEKDPQKRFTSSQFIADVRKAQKQLFADPSTDDDPYATKILPREQIQQMAGSMPQAVGRANREKPTQSVFKSKKFIMLLIGILLVGFFTGAFLSFGKFWSNAEVAVPNVVGQTQQQAKAMLEDKKLRVEISQKYSSEEPAGIVISQTPEAGTTVKEERTVTIYVSKGAEQVAVPDVTGISKEDAEKQLSKLGLKIGNITEEFSNKPAGTVLRQSPGAGDRMDKGKSVDLVVSKGAEEKKAAVPDVIGSSRNSAVSIIERAGLTVGSVTERESDREPGTVLEESPQAGSQVKDGSSISLVVAKQRSAVQEKDSKSSDKKAAADKKNN